MPRDLLVGRSILVVEDEAMISMLLEDMLTDLGCTTVGTTGNITQALAAVESETFDAAVLDINLNGERTTAVAAALRSKSIPFIYATGYGAAGPEYEFNQQPLLTKPFTQDDLERALRSLMS